MMRSRTVGRLLSLAVLAIAGCGGDDEQDDSSRDARETAADTATTARKDVVFDDRRIVIPGRDVGDVDLTKLPLGDDRISAAPARGKLYLCSGFGEGGGGGAQQEGSWIHGETYDLTEKLFVQGKARWPNAAFDTRVRGDERILEGNDLPVDHTTGTFPVASDDPAYAIDRNPNSIQVNDYELTLPADPSEADEAQCVGGEVGFLLSGVVLNNALDAERRDAIAHEVQDHCFGHPNPSGYHYHSVSPCVEDSNDGHSKLLGYALDGFGIYGHRGENGEVLTNEDLDDCHGHVHEIEWERERVEMFHYHATWEFPYTAGCFRGRSSVEGPALPPKGGPPPAGP